MNKLFIDCNILIDWLTDRQPFANHATSLLSLVEAGNAIGFVSPLTLSNTYYIFRKQTNKKTANSFLDDAIRLFNIVDVTKRITIRAIENKYKDFEDDLHYFTALEHQLDYIITRNKSDFAQTDIKIKTAEEYLNEIY